jgi:tRNA-splicing ligase RtcB
MELAGVYAYAGRDWVVDETLRLIGATETDRVHNNHNFAWRETHFDEDLVVVRKGATPAFPGQRGFVGGSMGDKSVFLRGTESDAGPNLLYSTVHGAGRVMGRMQARGKRAKDGTWKRKPEVDRDEMEEWLARLGVIRRGGDLDEAPQAYRRLPDVLADQGDTIDVEYELTPLIVCMAGRDRW